jgi:Tol biopolymer transport system component
MPTVSATTVTRLPNHSTSTSIPTYTAVASSAPTATLDLTQQARYIEATQVAQFSDGCEDVDYSVNDISPDGKWLASSCGNQRDQTLVVQNKEGTNWVLNFKDFVHPDSFLDADPRGVLFSEFWSPDGEYLYFAPVLGYEGGGNDCFPGIGLYGLFRLDLRTGSWVTLIPATHVFPGYEIDFAPTGRRYATDMNGVTITDLKTGRVTQIDVDGVIDLSWSPDGTRLAYSVATCGEQVVESSAAYVWDASTNQSQVLLTTNETVLRPEAWVDNTTLRVTGEEWIGGDLLYTVYIYDLVQQGLAFTGTATPSLK